ncbi:citrate synthase [Cerasibacillus terrae]|uniref:Citrate synthase n=1 Tax=Cerasibacillus terrae TaxID=2498845 RepID=A0A5C8NZF3_9BACI|nr:citrate synthase [Cerasibacillus terrae]TXL66708.1 citrate synthase [Cerasibacillus terrae]
MQTTNKFVPGLDGVVASETAISLLDTKEEKIIIRGYELIELSRENDFLDMVHLLLENSLPTAEEKEKLDKKLKDNYGLPKEIYDILKLLPKDTHPMDGLRTGLSSLGGFDKDLLDFSTEVNKDRAYDLLAKLPALIVNSYHILNGDEPIEPRQDLSYGANFLYMVTGRVPSKLEEEIFDRALLLYSEHEMPNSTFTARVIASTMSDLYGALTGAVASLKGYLHGGANEAVMHDLLKADSASEFEELIMNKLRNKEKVMGFGHRVYMKKMDPRALVMKDALKQLCEAKGDYKLLEMCEAGEKVMEREIGIYPNLDYYVAPCYWLLDIPIPLYTPIFYGSRASGLTAHVIEQHDNNRLFRPRVKYTGEQYSPIK